MLFKNETTKPMYDSQGDDRSKTPRLYAVSPSSVKTAAQLSYCYLKEAERARTRKPEGDICSE